MAPGASLDGWKSRTLRTGTQGSRCLVPLLPPCRQPPLRAETTSVRGWGGPVLTVGVPCLCLHLPIFGVLPAGKAQAAPESAYHPGAFPISKHLQLEVPWGDQVKIPNSTPQRSTLEKRTFSL